MNNLAAVENVVQSSSGQVDRCLLPVLRVGLANKESLAETNLYQVERRSRRCGSSGRSVCQSLFNIPRLGAMKMPVQMSAV